MWFIVFHDVVKEDNLAAVKVVVDESPFSLFLSYFFSVLSCFISIFFFCARRRGGDHRRAEEEEEMTFTRRPRCNITAAAAHDERYADMF